MSDRTMDPGAYRDFLRELFDIFDGIKIDLASGKVERGDKQKADSRKEPSEKKKDTDIKPPTKVRFTDDDDSEKESSEKKGKVCNLARTSVDERLGNLGEIVGAMYDDVKDFRERLLVEEATSDADAVVLAELRKDLTSLEGDVAYVNKEIGNLYKEMKSLKDIIKDLKGCRRTYQQGSWPAGATSPIGASWTCISSVNYGSGTDKFGY